MGSMYIYAVLLINAVLTVNKKLALELSFYFIFSTLFKMPSFKAFILANSLLLNTVTFYRFLVQPSPSRTVSHPDIRTASSLLQFQKALHILPVIDVYYLSPFCFLDDVVYWIILVWAAWFYVFGWFCVIFICQI